MLSVLGTIGMFLIGYGMIKHDEYKSNQKSKIYAEQCKNTDRELEQDLFYRSVLYKTFEDGTPVNPHIMYSCERYWAINEQLKKKGLRLTPESREYLMCQGGIFDENGLSPKNPHYKGK